MARRRSDAFYGFLGWFGNSRVVTRLHPIAYRLSGGRSVVGRNLGMLNVVLVTIGRRTGRAREVPLLAVEDRDRIVVVASKDGSDRQPGWIWNLRARPEARVRVGREICDVRAREAEGDERERLWRLASTAYPGYDVYQPRTARGNPVVVLEPTAGAGRASANPGES